MLDIFIKIPLIAVMIFAIAIAIYLIFIILKSSICFSPIPDFSLISSYCLMLYKQESEKELSEKLLSGQITFDEYERYWWECVGENNES